MSVYSVVLFFHVSGAIGYFISMGIWLFGLSVMRRAQRVEQVRAITNLIAFSGPLSGVSLLLILATGLYLAGSVWGFRTGWIDVALISVILMAPVAAALIEPRRRALNRQAKEAPEGEIPETLGQRIHDPVLATAVQTVVTLLLGIVFLMTTKPPLAGSIIVMAVALVLGLVSSLLLYARPRQQRAAAPANRV